MLFLEFLFLFANLCCFETLWYLQIGLSMIKFGFLAPVVKISPIFHLNATTESATFFTYQIVLKFPEHRGISVAAFLFICFHTLLSLYDFGLRIFTIYQIKQIHEKQKANRKNQALKLNQMNPTINYSDGHSFKPTVAQGGFRDDLELNRILTTINYPGFKSTVSQAGFQGVLAT
uniref:Uncharacterized protein n=1 Tax=Acrobeloides nanus TaxID=290746 RepID=A0A914E2X4_9BILA